MSYLTEAFKQLNIIDEDLFPTDSEGLNKLKDFMKSDIDDEDLVVYDETANNEDEIKDSYNGKVILRCNVCKSYFFKEPKSVIIDAEVGLANVGDECCYCHNDMGYNIVGVVAPYAADVSKEERAEVTHEEPTEVDVEVNDAEVKPEDVNESVKRVNESAVTVGAVMDQLNKCYGKCNIAFKYDTGEEVTDFHKVVVNWANKNHKRVIELRAATLEAGDIDLNAIKTSGGYDIIYIEDIDRISDDLRHDTGELVRDMKGHVVATAYNKSKVDQSIASRFKWLGSVNESVKRVNKSKPIKSIKEGLDTDDCDDQKTIKVFNKIYNKYKNKFNKFGLEDDFDIKVSDNSLLCSFCPDSDKVNEDNVDSLIDLMYDLIDDIDNTSFTVHSLEINDNEYDLDNYGLEYFDEIDSDILDNLDDTIFINADTSETSPKIQEFVDVINDEMLGNGRYGPFGPINDAEDFYNQFQKSYKFVSGDDGENDTFFENHYSDIYDEWLNTVDIDEYNEEHEDEDLNESVKRLNEETNYDKVMRVLNNMKKGEPIREDLNLDDIDFDNPGQAVGAGLIATDKLLHNPEKADEFVKHMESKYNLEGSEITYLEDFVATTLEGDNFHTEAKKYYRGKLPVRYAKDLTDKDKKYIDALFDKCKAESDLEDLLFKSINNLSLELSESVKKIDEDLKDVSITTDDTKIQMTAEENGKVTVTTEPVKNEVNIEDAEVVKPLSAADKDVIANNDGEDGEEVLDDTAIDFDEINDKDLDKLGEKYFTKVYDNVKSFKSTACKLNESGIILEGKITFKSGKEAKTAFNFNEAYVTKTGKVKLIGENAQFAKNKKAFTLTGSLNNKKLVVESFTYNYRTKDEKTGKSTRLYGTVSK